MGERSVLGDVGSSGILLHARVLGAASPLWSSLALASTLLVAAVGTGLALIVGRLVDAVQAAATGSPSAVPDAVRWSVALVILLLAGPLVQTAAGATSARMSALYEAHLIALVAETLMRPRGVSWLADGSQDAVRRLPDAVRQWRFRAGADGTWLVLGLRAGGIGAFVLVCTWHGRAAVLVSAAFVVLQLAWSRWIARLYVPEETETMRSAERAEYLRRVATRSDEAKEVRLFGLADFVVDRFVEASHRTRLLVAARHRGAVRPVIWATALVVAVLGAVLAFLVTESVSGAVSVGETLVVLQALVGLSAFGPVGDDAGDGLTTVAATTRQLVVARRSLGLPAVRLAPTPRSSAGAGGAGTVDAVPSSAPASAIDLRDVSFTYPGRSEAVLDGLSWHVPAGQSVAVVGVNGAGKSTLMALLAGLREPTSGQVLVGGAPAAGADGAVSVVLQDFVRYPLSLRENVGFGHPSALTDQPALDAALRRAGGDSVLERLHHGWDQVLSAAVAGGTDLSGGQWQRVALARAFVAVAQGAGVLVLDEPTSSLDVRAEAALFEHFLEATRGVTTVLVSHRLSSVRHADRIVVLSGGRIVEDGGHDELVAAGGEYARMFALQAARFSRDERGAGGTPPPRSTDDPGARSRGRGRS